ncbi:MAG: hypothetical protein M1814_006372 [Vezdaea aestivalis]|nr:MAG: hypothetical protein M1814_006372 [Vezdaea aestivalis]
MASYKGPGAAPPLDGSSLRIAIVYARWNSEFTTSLADGAKKALLAASVPEANIVVESVPGAWELPLACQRLYAASQVQGTQNSSSLSAGDLLGSTTDLTIASPASSKAPFDAVIAIGCLIKGETMHFEYIAEAVSQGLMRVQLDSGVPVVFGVLTVLKEDQAKARAGLAGHDNHGEDWGKAAVELGVKRNQWAKGEITGP